MTITAYTLSSGVEMSRLHPRTFEIPTEAARRAVKVGDFVKLRFLWIEGGLCSGNVVGGERMWVEVTTTEENGRFVGILRSEPVEDSAPVKQGATVGFREEHILDIDTETVVEEPSPLVRLATLALRCFGGLRPTAH